MTPKVKATSSHPDQYDPAEDDDQEPTPTPNPDNGDGESEAQVRSKEAAKYRLRAKAAEEKLAKAEARLAELEKGKGEGDSAGDSRDPTELEAENQELRIGNAFLEEAAGRFTDLGAAYKLLDRALISFTGDNVVKGMQDAVAHVADRYPFLVVDEGKGRAGADKTQPDPGGPSGTPFNGPRKSNEGLDMAALAKKFPSLQKRLRG